MSALLVRRMDDSLKLRLRVRAARHGRSMEEEVRVILKTVLAQDEPSPPPNLATLIRGRLAEAGGGVELELPAREPARRPPDFS